jgi:hypothetical protein
MREAALLGFLFLPGPETMGMARALKLSMACGRGIRVQAGRAFDNINKKPDVKDKVPSEGAPYAPPRRYRKPPLRMAERPAMRLLDRCVGAYGRPSGRAFVIIKVVLFPAPMNERPPKARCLRPFRIRPKAPLLTCHASFLVLLARLQ